ncbi:MAG: nitrogenase [Methanobrevibacter sp.]|jgi:nitrogenase molybdenum-iron protein beta chain|nr:nitrogenase [Candidatus Methanovirga meridionalis]
MVEKCKHSSQNEKYYVVEAPRYSCALAGVYQLTIGLNKSVPILHSGPGCGMVQVHGTGLASGFNSTGDYGSTNTPCSSLVEDHVIFGGEQKLRDLVDTTLQMFNAELFVVISGCVPALIGDDVNAVVEEFKNKASIIHVNAPGFVANSFQSYELFFDVIIDKLLMPAKKKKNLVNIFGIAPFQHIFWKGELYSIKKLLKNIGIEANVIFNQNKPIESLNNIPKAAYNIVLSPWIGRETVKKLEKKFNTPFITFQGPPVGSIQTSKFLREVSEKLNIPSKKVEKFIEEEEGRVYRLMEFAADNIIVYNPASYFALIADSNTAVSISKFITDELSYLPEIIIITDEPPEDYREDIIKSLQSDEVGYKVEVIFENDSYKIKKNLEGRSFATLFGSSIESKVAEDLMVLYYPITYPAYNRLILGANYVGYDGGISFLEGARSINLGPL